ncbi:unnamed protein product [Lactuca saligna]|uniref:Uncharacterized protein n=1 Tax=Lactuca saligna TaxID=75948 RepID=A0AA36E744_LACSI|nr:unnamed protein product [Lactuca saligna]
MTIVKLFVHVFLLLLICTSEYNVCGRKLVDQEKTSLGVMATLNDIVTDVDIGADGISDGTRSAMLSIEKLLQSILGSLQRIDARDIVTPTGGYMGDNLEKTNFGGGGGVVGARTTP